MRLPPPPGPGSRGFTLIELVIVIVILGIVASVALPRYQDLRANARANTIRGQLGGIRAALAIQYARTSLRTGNPAWPTLNGTIFSDGLVPRDPVLGRRTVRAARSPNNTGGWMYWQPTGRVKCNLYAYSTY